MKEIKPIERPIWSSLYVPEMRYMDSLDALNEWFDKHVAPLNQLIEEGRKCHWKDEPVTSYKCIHWFKEPAHTHSAFLLGITPIEKESAEDVLRDWISWMDGQVKKAQPNASMDHDAEYLYHRAKSALEGK